MVTPREVRRGEVFLVDLNPTRGGEMRKARPCVIVSPDDLNQHLTTFIIAPLTTGAREYPFRIACRFAGRVGHVVLDQIRAVDRARLIRKLGRLSAPTLNHALSVLQEMFAA